jgi:hypothetical protein
LFLLITPKIFKDNPSSRLYGYLINEYMNQPQSLKRDLPHRTENICFEKLSKKIGWLNWEDFKNVNHKCCLWLK